MLIHSIGYTGKDNNKLQTNSLHKSDKMTGILNNSGIKPSFGSEESYSDRFSSIVQSLSDNLNTLTEVLIHDNRERNFETYLNAFSMKKTRQLIKNFRQLNIEAFNNKWLYNLDVDSDFFNRLLKSSGINSVMQMEMFARTYTSNPDSRKIFERQEIEAVKIYGLLKSKDDIAKYPELLLYLYNQEGEKENPDYKNLNEYTEFLKQIGLSDFKDFDRKFSHLKSDFNDFASIADKVDAIDYLRDTYDAKIAYLENIIAENPALKSFSAQKIYSKITDIIDTLYNNDSAFNGKAPAIINYAMASDKFKAYSLKAAAPFFNDFQTVQDKIMLYELLNECSISPDTFNAITAKTIVSDADILNCIINKQELSKYIADYKKINPEEGESFYKKNADIINTFYDEKSGNIEGVNALIDFTDRMNINSSESFLSFYNRASLTKKKKISSDELKSFVELFQYSDSKDLFKQAKEQNISVVDMLKAEKAKFEKVKDDIEKFILTDTTAYFAGKTPLEVYRSYSDLFAVSDDNTAEILQNITAFSIDSSEEYAQKTEQISQFEKFFPNKKTLLEFISESKIKFDGTEEDEEYRQNCLEVFNSLYDESDIEKSQGRINSIVSSGFLNKSKIKLPEFLAKMPDNKTKTKVLSVIADKKVPSIQAFERFFKIYKHSNGSKHTLFEYLQNLPQDVDFDLSNEILFSLQYKINSLNIPVDINSSNISSINIEKLKTSRDISTEDAISSVNDILGRAEDSNFIAALPNAVDNNQQKYNAFRIAQDIAVRKDKSDESYQNIVRILGLDKDVLGLDSNCSIYTYIQAIKNVLPEEFVKFVNSNDWLDYKDDGETIPNLVLHARLRAIDRFALNNADTVESLYTTETKEMLKALFKSVYDSKPLSVTGTDSSKRIIIDSDYQSNIIEAVFANQGEMITIVPARKQKN